MAYDSLRKQHSKSHESTREDEPLFNSLKNALKWSETRDAEGYVNIASLLALPQFSHDTIQDILRVVKNEKSFHVKNETELRLAQISVRQGLSVWVLNSALMKQIYTIDSNVIYRTSLKCLRTIRMQGFGRGDDHYIYMTTRIDEIPSYSKMRNDVRIAIYIDANRAIRDGFSFLKYSDKVILSPGDKYGYLPVIYIEKIQDLITDELL